MTLIRENITTLKTFSQGIERGISNAQKAVWGNLRSALARKAVTSAWPAYYPLGFVGQNQDIAESKLGAAAAYSYVYEVRGCIDAITDALETLDWNIVSYPDGIRAKQVGEVLANRYDLKPRHPLQRAIYRYQHANDNGLLSAMAYDYLLYGEVYVEKTQNDFGHNRGLETLNPLGTQPYYTTNIQWYRYGWNNQFIQISPEDIAFLHNRNPQNDFIGLALALTVMNKINILRNLDRFLRDYFINNARPGMVVAPSSDEFKFSALDYETIKKNFSEALKGVGNQFGTFISQVPLSATAYDQPDMAKNVTVEDRQSEAILKVYRVPGVMLGSTANNPYRDSDEARQWFYLNVVIPLAKKLQTFINNEIMPFFDSSGLTIFEIDTSAFDEVTQADRLEAEVVNSQLQNGYISLAQAAKIQERDSAKWMENRYLVRGLPMTPVQIDTLITAEIAAAQQAALPQPAFAGMQERTPLLGAGESGASVRQRDYDTADNDNAEEQQKAIPTDRSGSYCVMGYFDDTRPLQRLQDMLRSQLGEQSNYEAPDTFHVTLLYTEDVQFYHIQDSLPLNPAAFSVTIDGMGVFDTPNGKAIHLTIRKEGTLPGLQAALAMTAKEHGLTISPYSEVEAYTPHITLAYCEQSVQTVDITPFTLLVNRLVVTGDDYAPIIEQHLKSAITIDDHTYRVETRSPITPEDLQKEQFAELKAWERFIKARWGKSETRPFEPVYWRGDYGDALQTALTTEMQGGGEYKADTIKALFAQYRERAALKAIQATRLDFENDFEDVMGSALRGDIDRRRWAARVRAIVKRAINQAFRDGLKDGGVDAEPDATEQEQIDSTVKEQSQYVTDLGAKLFKDEQVTEDMAKQKPAMWWNNSIFPAYYMGFESAAANQMVEFVGEDGDENCLTCRKLKGQRHRLKTWNSKGLNPTDPNNRENFICKLWNCEHFLQQTNAKAFGRWV